VFERLGKEKLSSADLVCELAADKEGLWSAFGKTGKPITMKQVANILSRYEIEPKTIRVHGADGTFKGYDIGSFRDAFERYISSLSLEGAVRTVTSVTTLFSQEKSSNPSVTSTYGVTDENVEKLSDISHVTDVTDQILPRGKREKHEGQNGHAAPYENGVMEGSTLPPLRRSSRWNRAAMFGRRRPHVAPSRLSAPVP
jgi:Protein of unknown function (DUF3631)